MGRGLCRRVFHSREAATVNFGRRSLKGQAMMTKQSGDADEPRRNTTGEMKSRLNPKQFK